MQEEYQSTKVQGQPPMSRRGFLACGILTAASAVILPHGRAVGAVNNFLAAERTLSFYNTHTGEELTSTYWRKGEYLHQALTDIDYLLRDHRTGEIKRIDPALLDLLHALHARAGGREPFHLISGYRSPRTNAMLSKQGRGVAGKSQHLLGRAVDIRLPRCGLECLHQAAIELRAGGVGYYPKSDFVHVDTGRVRYW